MNAIKNSLEEYHRKIILREQVEPEEKFENIPKWIWIFSILLLFIMGFYLGKYGGSWSTVAHEVEQPRFAIATNIKREVKGDQVYAGVCQTCHQADGLGIAGQYPPLAGSEWLLGDIETPISIVLYGIEGPITVKGHNYNNKMTPFYDKLSDEEIAAVLTHERASWGNSVSAIKTENVNEIRTKLGIRGPLSAEEILTAKLGKK